MKVIPADAFRCHTKTCQRIALVRMDWPGAGPVNYCLLCAELGQGILSTLAWPTGRIEHLPRHEGTAEAVRAQSNELIERVALAFERARGEATERCDVEGCPRCEARRPV